MDGDRQASRSRATAPVVLALLLGTLGGFALGRGTPRPPASAPGASGAPVAAADDSPILASVGDESLSLAEFDERWRQLDPTEQSFHGARAQESGLASGRAHFLDQLVEEMLLAREARRRGLDQRADVRAATRACANRIVSRPLLAREVRAAAIPRSELETWYASHSEAFGTPLRVQVREIIVTRTISGPGDTTGDEAAARARAEELLARARGGESFAAIAESSSEAPSARYGGLVGWVTAGRFARAWEEKALALQAGEISEILEVPEGFAILSADAREESSIPPLDEVQDRVLDILLADDAGALQRRYNVFVRGLREAEKVSVHAELLGRDAPAAPDAGGSGPSGASVAPGAGGSGG